MTTYENVPTGARERLESLSDAQLTAELASIRDALKIHAPHVDTSLRARSATGALLASESYVLAVQLHRQDCRELGMCSRCSSDNIDATRCRTCGLEV